MTVEKMVEPPVQILTKTENQIEFCETKVPTIMDHEVSVKQATPQVVKFSAAPPEGEPLPQPIAEPLQLENTLATPRGLRTAWALEDLK